ncbi:hypothetical protein NDU88_003744 [Pleurodeles waltl]|uniref:Uncharacterized protein n=1 Tax=Pleurodeles waltl TaxID=8319 RepID=A0AAV7LJD2_PLEWA|nr:hypothetical protein NDU88_003744 [Pleurodeles waltl]
MGQTHVLSTVGVRRNAWNACSRREMSIQVVNAAGNTDRRITRYMENLSLKHEASFESVCPGNTLTEAIPLRELTDSMALCSLGTHAPEAHSPLKALHWANNSPAFKVMATTKKLTKSFRVASM